MQSVASRIWTRIVVSISYDDNHYTTGTDIRYITESGRKNKQARILVSPKRKKGKVFALFWHSTAITSVYPNEIPTQLLGTLTLPLELADLFRQLPLFDRHLSLTVANSYLFIALGPCLFSFSSGLVRNLSRKPIMWVSRQNKQRNPLTGDHPHPHSHPQNERPPSCHNNVSVN